MKKTTILLLLPFLIATQKGVVSQSYYMEAGVPFIQNYSSKEYGAHSQNFAIAQDDKGIMYFGNFMGTLQFDGTNWKTILTSNISKISSLAIDNEGRIYVGAMGEFGYLETSEKGSLAFKSIQTDSLKSKNQIGEIKHIYIHNEVVYFIAHNSIITYSKEKVEILEVKNEIIYAQLSAGKLFCQLENIGLTKLVNNEFHRINGGEHFIGSIDVKSILKYNENKFIIATDIQGLFILDENGVKVFNSEARNYLIKNNLTCGAKLQHGSYAFGTQRGGVVTIDVNGNLQQVVSTTTGLQSNYINFLFPINNCIWVALNNGLSRIETPSPLSLHNNISGIEGSVLHIEKINNNLYIGTFEGLFYQDKSSALFKKIQGINTACWSFLKTNNSILVATSEGILEIKENSINQLSTDFTLSVHQSKLAKEKIYAATTNGVTVLSKKGNSWIKQGQIKDIKHEIREIEEDKDGMLWFNSPPNGIYSFNPNSNKVKQYNVNSGLPSIFGNHFCNLNQSLIIATMEGLFIFDNSSERFIKHELNGFDSVFSRHWHNKVVKDNSGAIWTIKGDETSIAKFSRVNQTKYKESKLAFNQIADFIIWDIYFDDNNIVWLGGPDGLIRYNSNIEIDYKKDYNVLFKKILTNKDSLLYEGYGFLTVINDSTIEIKNTTQRLKRGSNIHISFSAASYNYKESTKYRYFLEGFDQSWSEWNTNNEKEYTNLKGGNYVFHVQAKDIYGNLSKESLYKFHVLTPWYMQWWSYIFYFIILAGIIYLIVRWRIKRLAKEKQVLESLVQERTAEISEQKEEIERQSKGIAMKNYELEKINYIVKTINSEINLTNMLYSILEKTKVIRGVEKATALVLEKETGKYMFKASFGWDLSTMGLSDIRLSQEESEIRYIDGTDEIFEDVFYAKEVNYSQPIAQLDNLEKPKSKLVMVLKIKNSVEGFVLLENMHKKNAFTEEDLSLVRNLKEHIISAFIKAKILEDLQETLQNLKKTQEELIRQEKLASVGKLTKGIVDRIINPLNYINNYSNLTHEFIEEIKEILGENKEIIPSEILNELEELTLMSTGNLEKIKNHGTNTARIVKAMESLLKDKSNNFIETEINSLSTKKVELAYKAATEKHKNANIKLRFNLQDNLGQVKIMHEEFGQVINALIDNAFYILIEKAKTNPNYKPEISITTEASNSYAIISIMDNGTGMKQSEIAKIFDPFFTTKITSEGSGLGLYMCKDIIEVHNGKLEVESTEGESTTFKISLPMSNNTSSHN